MMSMYDELMKAQDTIAELEAENHRLKEERNRAIELMEYHREANNRILDMLADDRLSFLDMNPAPIHLHMPPEIVEKYMNDLGIQRKSPDESSSD